MREEIIKAIQKVIGKKETHLEIPENSKFGDYSTNIAMQIGSKGGFPGLNIMFGKGYDSPKERAGKIIEKLKIDKDLMKIIEKVEIAGPGFINFYLKKTVLLDILVNIRKQFDTYGSSTIGAGKTVVIDYSAPNIAKPFGIGHLRSTIIGQALYNIYKSQGYRVIGDNHLGDWGTQFGKLIYMIKKENVKKFDIKILENLYVQFHKSANNPRFTEEMENGAREWFKKLENGDIEAREIWQRCVDVSKVEFDKIYRLLDVKIDVALGESYYEKIMQDMINDKNINKYLVSMGSPSKGWVVDLTKYGIKVPLMFLKSDGATTYATRDLATIAFRMKKWNPQIIIYEVGNEQNLHFTQVFAAAYELGIADEKKVILHHTKHGLYLAPDGKKFSTRKGKTIKLEEVLNEAIKRARELGSKSEELAREVGIGSIKYYDLMHSVQSDVVFDWEKILNMEGNSGPYLQYTYARTQSVLDKAGDYKADVIKEGELDDQEFAVLRTLIYFPEIVTEAAEKYAPNLICNYLYDLAQRYNSFYNSEKIIGSERENLRLQLTSTTGTVLKNGLELLGIKSPKRM